MDRELEQLVWQRANSHCEYCRLPALEWLRFQIDHVIAEKHHGRTEEGNLALSCFHCNSFKGPNISGVDPLTGKITRPFHPRRDAWDKHFNGTAHCCLANRQWVELRSTSYESTILV